MTKPHYIGIDLGGSKIAGAAVSFSPKLSVGKIIQFETPKNEKAIFKILLDIISQIRKTQAVQGIGIGFAGQVNPDKKLIVHAANIQSLSGISLMPLEKKLGLPITLRNDAQCFALGETIFGAGKGKPYVVGVTIGTGVGGGIVKDGELFSGAHFSAGEMGHIQIIPSGLLCACGNRGCLEQYINKKAIIARYKNLTGRTASPKEIEVESYKKSVGGRQNPALSVIREAGTILGQGLSMVAKVIDPDLFILGGGIAKTKTLYAPTRIEFQKTAFSSEKTIRIVPSLLGGTKAGIVGAAWEAHKTK